DVGAGADRAPAPAAVAHLDLHAHHARRARLRPRQDAYLVVAQVQLRPHRVEARQALHQGAVERVDRTVADGGGVLVAAADLDAHRRLAAPFFPVVALVDHDGEAVQSEVRPVLATHLP